MRKTPKTLSVILLISLWLILFFGSSMSFAAAYYVRTDGGNHLQCTGQTDSPYPGQGSQQDCAWNHPFQALPPGASPRISGGDTLVISSGQYMMGFGAPGAEGCDAEVSFDCHMSPIPSGASPSSRTRVLGQGWNSGCANPPELWGTERTNLILNLTDSNNIEISCFEITDHSSCVEFHSGGLACKRDNPPYGPWSVWGIYAEDSSKVALRHLNIHGLAHGGILAGRLTDWTVENVRIAGNGWVGWDGDIDGDDSNSGTLLFRHWEVEWNGCGESYPGGAPIGCWAQTAGGYGDGVGTGATGGDWIIEDSQFLHNTSDGLDLLYHSLGGRITLNRVRAEGNAGNQVKVTGETTITNSVLVGNCAFFEGKPFTYNVDPCRALGNALEIVYTGGESVRIMNSTFYGQGDGLIGGGAREGYACTGGETLQVRNSLFQGDVEYLGDGSDTVFYFYQEGCGNLRLDSDYNIINGAKNVSCGTTDAYVKSGSKDLCQDPLLVGPLSGQTYGMTLRQESPAKNSGTSIGAPDIDIIGTPRPLGSGYDRGAYEYQESARQPSIMNLMLLLL